MSSHLVNYFSPLLNKVILLAPPSCHMSCGPGILQSLDPDNTPLLSEIHVFSAPSYCYQIWATSISVLSTSVSILYPPAKQGICLFSPLMSFWVSFIRKRRITLQLPNTKKVQGKPEDSWNLAARGAAGHSSTEITR